VCWEWIAPKRDKTVFGRKEPAVRKWSVASVVIGVALLLTDLSGQQPAPGPYVAGELLVKFRSSATTAQRDRALSSQGASRIRRFDRVDIDQVRIPPGLTIDQALARFHNMPDVLAVQPNYTRHIIGQAAPPNDPYWLDGSLWGLNKIQAQLAWTNYSSGDGSVVIADIDTGIDYTHPDLAANVWRNPAEIPGNGIDDDGDGYVDDVYGIDTANHDSDPMDDQGHGTHTAGTLAAVGNNGIGVVGVNWNAKVLSCKFLDSTGYGTDAGAIECFNYIVMLKERGVNIRVSSNSWGELRGSNPPAAALEDAIDAAGSAGILNVFGAGNNSVNTDTNPFDPASYPLASIVSVASTGTTDKLSSFSNYGTTSVDLAAPGENILSTYPGGDYQYLSGTSMATPHVAGTAALLAGMNPTLSVDALKALLLDNVDKIGSLGSKVASGGRLNAFKAASAVGTAPPNLPPTVLVTGPADGASFKQPVNVTVTAQASDADGSVASVTFYANGSPIGLDQTSPYSVTWNNVPPGSYTLTAVAADNLGATTTSAPVHMTVVADQPPTVAISSPADGTVFTSPASVTISATASDSDGTVQQVVFYADGAAIGTDTASPYTATWNAPTGDHTLTTAATDDFGNVTTSSPVHITVDPIPGRLDVAAAANGGVASASSTLSANYPPSGAIDGDRKGLNWGAGGGWNDGTQNQSPDWLEVDFHGQKLIEEVDVFSMQDNYTNPVDPTPTMTFTYYGLRAFDVQYWDGSAWVDVPGGSITNNNLVWRQVVFAPLTTTKVRLYITGALNGYSRVMELEAWGVATGGNTPPSVAITSPANGATFTTPATIPVTAAASDSDGAIQLVDFYADGVAIGTATASPYTITWTGAIAGTHTLTAVASDNQGATTTSAPVSVTVAAGNVPPTVAITSPADSATFTSPATIPIVATAGDADGVVEQVAFYANGTLIGTATSSPYTVTWTGVAAGSYTLTAVATDNVGATSTSAPVHITTDPIANRINVAAATNGGTATASSTYNANYPPSATINGDRKGLNWGAGGGWNDATPNAWPDWLEVDFNGAKLIDEVDVFSMQDNYTAPADPTPTMTFTYYGLTAFQVQYWDGSTWVTAPGGSIAGNNLVWRQATFAPLTTTRIRVNITAAASGYSRVMEVEAWGAASTVNTPPSVAITSPADGANFTAPATIPVTATASDLDGTIQQVAFYGDGTQIGTATASPYTVTWTGVTAGTHTLTAVATDNGGATTTSAPVSVTVAPGNTLPSVAITSPAPGATFSAPATIAVSAAASDSDGTIQQVAFYASGAAIGTVTTSPYTVTWSNVSAGSYTLTAVATDNQGATTTSAPVAVTVNPIASQINLAAAVNGGVATASSTYNANYPPSATINGDRKGLNWGAGGGWNDATPNSWPDWVEVDFNGSKRLDEVDVFSMQDNYRTPADPTPTMTFTYYGLTAFQVQYWNGSGWTTVPGGSVANNNLVWRQVTFSPVTTTKMRIYITGSASGYSRMVEVEAWGTAAPDDIPPTVAITSPADGTGFTAPATVPVTATASDSDGSVQKVDFYANGTLIGTAAASPYAMTWSNVLAGSYTLTAVATDNLGVTTTSAPVTITADPIANRINVAAAANGGAATASSTYNANYPPSGAIDGDRKGLNWGAGGGWNDATPNQSPDWLEVDFNGPKLIDEMDVFSMQDNYRTPVEPTPTLTFTYYGLVAFQFQYWDGSVWVTVPGGSISGNNLVWRQVTFAPVTTTKVRVYITGSLSGYSRVMELEAWGAAAGGPPRSAALSLGWSPSSERTARPSRPSTVSRNASNPGSRERAPGR
jgi:Subtilase family/Bacterial Ig domain/Fervidolysin N-terminal prodomain/F5/8 type C domain